MSRGGATAADTIRIGSGGAAARFLAEHRDIADWIRAPALVLSVAAAIVTIIALIDPIPGDEIAAGSLASALFRVATAR